MMAAIGCKEKSKSFDKFNANAPVFVDVALAATQIVDNMVQRRKANNILFEKNAPTLWPSGGLTVVNMIDAIQRGDNLPEFPTTKI